MDRSILVDMLCIVFGLGAWITVNGVWVELSQLVVHLPEGWSLPSYLSVIVQLANIGPIAYTLVHVIKPSPLKDLIAVSATTLLGSIACLLLVFFWHVTVYFYNAVRSVPLLVLVFFMALVDCTSSVLFLPFMSTFREKYLVSYMVGEGLSGFVPSILALVQGVGGNPECRNGTNGSEVEPYYPEPAFTTSSFFSILFVMDVSSLVAFFLLNFLPAVQSEKTPLVTAMEKADRGGDESPTDRELDITFRLHGETDVDNLDDVGKYVAISGKRSMSKQLLLFLLFLQAWSCALTNGVMTSVQSYSGLPYGNRVFHLCISLSTMANPLAVSVAFLFPTRKTSVATALVCAGTFTSFYLMATAILSPHPPLQGQVAGDVLVVSAWIVFTSLMSYAKMCIAYILREEGRNALFWCGVSTQAGSAVGALVMFVLINIYQLFHSYNPCK